MESPTCDVSLLHGIAHLWRQSVVETVDQDLQIYCYLWFWTPTPHPFVGGGGPELYLGPKYSLDRTIWSLIGHGLQPPTVHPHTFHPHQLFLNQFLKAYTYLGSENIGSYGYVQ